MMASQQGKSQVLGGHGGEGNDFLKKKLLQGFPSVWQNEEKQIKVKFGTR